MPCIITATKDKKEDHQMTLTGSFNSVVFPWNRKYALSFEEEKRNDINETELEEKDLNAQDGLILAEMILTMQNRFFRW